MKNPILIETNSSQIAHAIRNITDELSKEKGKPFRPGWGKRSSDLQSLTENIRELCKHLRKKEILYFLNELAEAYYI